MPASMRQREASRYRRCLQPQRVRIDLLPHRLAGLQAGNGSQGARSCGARGRTHGATQPTTTVQRSAAAHPGTVDPHPHQQRSRGMSRTGSQARYVMPRSMVVSGSFHHM